MASASLVSYDSIATSIHRAADDFAELVVRAPSRASGDVASARA
jgi:hypothetical protein